MKLSNETQTKGNIMNKAEERMVLAGIVTKNRQQVAALERRDPMTGTDRIEVSILKQIINQDRAEFKELYGEWL